MAQGRQTVGHRWVTPMKEGYLVHHPMEPYAKVRGVEPCTEETGQKSPELTKPHSNCCHEPPNLNQPSPDSMLDKTPTCSTLTNARLPAGIFFVFWL